MLTCFFVSFSSAPMGLQEGSSIGHVQTLEKHPEEDDIFSSKGEPAHAINNSLLVMYILLRCYNPVLVLTHSIIHTFR